MEKKYYKNKKNSKNYEDQNYTPSKGSRPPYDDGSSEIQTMIDYKAMKNLPLSSYAMKVDPYTEVNNPATPYHLLSRFNRVMGGNYRGDSNLDGGNLIQYNAAINSGFLEVFDTALGKLGINYRYLPVSPDDNIRGKDMVDEMIKAISEIVSSLNATTFKDQNIFYYGIETDMPMGSHTPRNINGHYIYTDLAEVIYAYCIQYQIFLQDLCSVFNMFNANRSRMGTMIRMSWNREVPLLNSYFGLLKKKSFLSLFDSLALNLAGEYVDIDWMRQVNTIQMVASRRSNSLSDPVKELVAVNNHPTTFNVYLFGDVIKSDDKFISTPVFSLDMMKFTINEATEPVSFYEAIEQLGVKLSINDTLLWARSSNPTSENSRFNQIKGYVDVLTYGMTVIKSTFTDLRTVLTIMARLGIVNWNLGTKLGITKDTDCELTNYLVVDSIIAESLSGASEVRFNDVTKRWRTFALWNIYFGVPEYVMKSGGSFLSFSVKQKVYDENVDTNIGYLPIAYSLKSFGSYGFLRTVSRKGDVVIINRSSDDDPTGIIISDISVLARLTPLTSQENLKMFVPTPTYGVSTLTEIGQSHLYRLMLQLCGVARIRKAIRFEVDGEEVVREFDDYALDPDYIAIYEYEIEDMTNEVISYCRGNGPFKVSTYGDSTLGFYGLSIGRK